MHLFIILNIHFHFSFLLIFHIFDIGYVYIQNLFLIEDSIFIIMTLKFFFINFIIIPFNLIIFIIDFRLMCYRFIIRKSISLIFMIK